MTARSEARHSSLAAEQRAPRPALWLHILLWAMQALLAAVYLAHGVLFLFPPPDVAAIMNAQLGRPFCIFLGTAELLAAAGLILPGVTRMLPWLISLAAAGLMIVMASATALHASRGEGSSAITTAVLFALVTFVAYMRWKVAPIRARGRA